jgi:hypothetical protein
MEAVLWPLLLLKKNAIPAVLLPQLGRTLINSPVSVQIFAALAVGNIALQRLGAKLGWGGRFFGKKNKAEDGDDESTMMQDQAYESSEEEYDEEEYSEEDVDYLEDLGFGRPRPTPRKAAAATAAAAASQESIVDGEDDATDAKKEKKKRGSFWGRTKKGNNEQSGGRYNGNRNENNAAAPAVKSAAITSIVERKSLFGYVIKMMIL